MPVKIRLMRIGANKRPFYRVVAVDERKKRTGGYLELLGTYNPLTEPKEIILKQDRIDTWIKNGAQLSDGFLRIIGKAPQRPPRKPKKEKKEAPAATDKPKGETNESEGSNESEEPKVEEEKVEVPEEPNGTEGTKLDEAPATPDSEKQETVIPNESEKSPDDNIEHADSSETDSTDKQ